MCDGSTQQGGNNCGNLTESTTQDREILVFNVTSPRLLSADRPNSFPQRTSGLRIFMQIPLFVDAIKELQVFQISPEDSLFSCPLCYTAQRIFRIFYISYTLPAISVSTSNSLYFARLLFIFLIRNEIIFIEIFQQTILRCMLYIYIVQDTNATNELTNCN